MEYACVVAAEKSRGIGLRGDLPWPKLPRDLAHFKRLTTQTSDANKQNAVIMGRLTWDAIPEKFRPLPGRINIVVSHQPEKLGLILADKSLDDALSRAQSLGAESIFVVGGAQIYNLAIVDRRCCTIYYTRIDAAFECDAFFPPFENGFKCVAQDEPITEAGYTYQFETWQRQRPQRLSAPFMSMVSGQGSSS